MTRWTVALAAAAFLVVAAPAAALAADGDSRDQADVDAYFDQVAAKLGQPGLYVDPDVTDLDSSEIAALDAATKSADAPMRIAVVPAEQISIGESYYKYLAWNGEEIADQLYDRVGVEGVYAVLVDADSSDDGRGFHAVQRADRGPTYYVGNAVDQAVDCCAPNYDSMLERFIQRAQVVDNPWYIDVAPWAGGIGGIAGLWWGGVTLASRRRRRQDERDHLELVRPMLNEEIIALSQQVSALPTATDERQSTYTKQILDAIEKARQRLDKAKTDANIEAVSTLLGSARYGMVCLEAVRAGKQVPEPTAPCFFDPRHGPSTTSTEWTPEEGAERRVDICAACAARLAANQQPEVRTVRIGDQNHPYWTLGERIAAYVDGYWTAGDQSWMFPDPKLRRIRDGMRDRWAADRPGGRFRNWTTNVGDSLNSMASSSTTYNDDDDSDGGGRSSGGGWSSRTSSSGGG
ncbi:hypothetical protein, partial [Tenggerimyces flavus]